MSLEIKLTDQQIRSSIEFLEFIRHFDANKEYNETWYDQVSENLKLLSNKKIQERFKKFAGKPITSEVVRQAILRSYNYTIAILLGNIEAIHGALGKYNFNFVVGCPRSGGSYLTKQYYLALGFNPKKVPGLLAHDGFPKAWPFYIGDGHNQHTDMARYFSEYFVMIELFFSNTKPINGKVIVPKKDINAAYHGAFFSSVIGKNIEYTITIRHPVTCCISTYEKSGGLHKDEKFGVRSTIEDFIRRDVLLTEVDHRNLQEQDYFDVYLKYWEQYHYNLALSGLLSNRRSVIVPYTKEGMEKNAQNYYSNVGSSDSAEEFLVYDKRDWHKEWAKKAEAGIIRVRDVWERTGLVFPVDEVMEMW